MRMVKTVAPVFSLKMLKLGSNRMREDICVASSVRTISPMRMMKLYREEFNVMDEVSEAFVGCVWMRFHFQFAAGKMHGYVGCGVSGCETFSFSPKFFERSTQIAKKRKGEGNGEKGEGMDGTGFRLSPAGGIASALPQTGTAYIVAGGHIEQFFLDKNWDSCNVA